MKHAVIYSLKVWVTGVVISLMITWAADIIAPYALSEYLYSGFVGRIAEILLFSLAYLIPFCLSMMILFAFGWSRRSIKALAALLTFILGWLPVAALLNISDEPISIGYKVGTLVYIFLNCLGIYFFLKAGISNNKTGISKFRDNIQTQELSNPSPIYS